MGRGIQRLQMSVFTWFFTQLPIFFCYQSARIFAKRGLRTARWTCWNPPGGLQDWHAKVRQAALEALSEASGLGLRSFQWVKDKIFSLPNSSKLAQWRLNIPKKGGWPSQISGHFDWPVCTFTLFLWCWHNLRSGYSPSGSKCAGLMQFTCRSLYILHPAIYL